MRQKTLATVCGAAIAGSLFLPWVKLPGAGNLSPWDTFKDFDWATLPDQPPLLIAFVASFALGALLTLLGLIGWVPRVLALITALVPVGIAGWVWFKAQDTLTSLGVPVPDMTDMSKLGEELLKVAGIGLWAWGVGALLLLLVALLDPGDRY